VVPGRVGDIEPRVVQIGVDPQGREGVCAEGFAPIQNAVFDNWTFYFLGRDFN
jgi:hypothetical protein